MTNAAVENVGGGRDDRSMSSQPRAFDFLHGTWSVRHALRRGRLEGTDEWDQHVGGAVCAPILGGTGQLDQIWLPHRGQLGSTLRLYDGEADVWRLHWSASDTGRLDPALEGRFVDGVGLFLGRDELDGRAIDVRFVWDEITDRHARWTQSFAWAGTDAWEANWTMDFDRVSDHAASASTSLPDLSRIGL